MMSTRFLRKHDADGWLQRVTEPVFLKLNAVYDRVVRSAVDRPWLAVLFMAAAGLVIWVVGGGLPSELAPLEDRSNLRIVVISPEGYTYERMDEFLDQFRSTVEELVPEKNILL